VAQIVDMPKLSDTMVTGKLLTWMVEEGQTVESGEAIAEVETDKATMELESSEAGVLLKRLANLDEPIPVGAPIAILGEKNEDITGMIQYADQLRQQAEAKFAESSGAKPKQKPQSSPTSPSFETTIHTSQKPNNGGGLRVSPVAQRMAAEHGIDVTQLQGTGPGGRIVKRDVQAYLNQGDTPTGSIPSVKTWQPETHGKTYEDIQLNSIRASMASRLPQSLGPVPHFYLETEVNAEALLRMKQDLQELLKEEIHITLSDILIKACALALTRHPEVNSQFLENSVRRFYTSNIGFAVAGQDTLLVPVIPACEQRTLSKIAEEREVLVKKAQQGRLSQEEMANGTFTISNLGMFGITRFSAVINPPQAAILAVGTVREEPVVKEGQIVPGKRMNLTLSCDHRAFDGAEGSRFLQTLKQILETPSSICL